MLCARKRRHLVKGDGRRSRAPRCSLRHRDFWRPRSQVSCVFGGVRFDDFFLLGVYFDRILVRRLQSECCA